MAGPVPEIAVLIVGAGPTGLALACDLARREVNFRIVDKAHEYFSGSRGKGLQPRSLEVLDDQAHVLHAYGGEAGAFVLVRPDGYIGWIGDSESLPAVRSYLQEIFPVLLSEVK